MKIVPVGLELAACGFTLDKEYDAKYEGLGAAAVTNDTGTQVVVHPESNPSWRIVEDYFEAQEQMNAEYRRRMDEMPFAPRESDPAGLDPHVRGAKLDAGKTRVWLMMSGFARALEKVAEVTTIGATKYTADGWIDVENGVERYMDAFGRHQLALGRGEQKDSNTGCDHKAQMIWNLLASYELELRDDL